MIAFQSSFRVRRNRSQGVGGWRKSLLSAGRLFVENAGLAVLVAIDHRVVRSTQTQISRAN